MRDDTIRRFTTVSGSEALDVGAFCSTRDASGEDVRTFDASGRVTTVADSARITTLRYDDEGRRVLVETRARGRDESAPRRSIYRYEGRYLVEHTHTNGARTCTVRFAYDARGCLSLQRDSCLRGEETRFTCDASGRIVRVEDFDETGTFESGYDVAYDERGRRSLFVAVSDGRVMKRFTYDGRGRLVTDGDGLHFDYDDDALTVTVRAPDERNGSQPLSLTYDFACRLATQGGT